MGLETFAYRIQEKSETLFQMKKPNFKYVKNQTLKGKTIKLT